MSFQTLFDFEKALCRFTGSAYAVVTDCCTHALELALLYDQVRSCEFSAFTYLSVPQLMHKLNIDYRLTNETWCGEYQLHGTRIWDSARRLEPNMYRASQIQCVSFGWSKPLHLGRCGALLLDDVEAYDHISRMRADGRDLSFEPWQDQQVFGPGFHYCPTLEICELGLAKLSEFSGQCQTAVYPDCRKIQIV